MTTDLHPPARLPEDAQARLRHWAAATPDHIALRHKRRGQWKGWRWADVLLETERLAAALRAQGLGPQARLAASGAFEPTLLVLALAADAVGAELVLLPPAADASALAAALERARPSHVYLQRREDRVLLAGLDAGASVAEVVLPAPAVAAGRPRRAGAGRIAWVEEGSEWPDGLALLLGHWLSGGDSLAFPERLASAGRDRRDVAPTVLLLSHGRLHALAGEIEARLAQPRSWRRRLCEWALRGPRRGLRRHLQARLHRQFGLQRLDAIVHDGGAGAAHPVWLTAPAEGRQ